MLTQSLQIGRLVKWKTRKLGNNVRNMGPSEKLSSYGVGFFSGY